MKKVFTCPCCAETHAYEITDAEAAMLADGARVQEALSKRDNFFREAFISHMCYSCQSHTFNVPAPGEDWGRMLGECDVCGAAIWEINDGVCKSCGNKIEYERSESKCGCEACQACSGDYNQLIGDHSCRCSKCSTSCKHLNG